MVVLKRIFFGSLALALVALSGDRAWAVGCAACREALASSGNNGLLNGIRWSVLLLLACPASLIGFFVWKLVRAHKKMLASAPPLVGTNLEKPLA